MNLTMLGTGNALATRCYNTCFVISDGPRHLLVDGGGGNGVLSQLERAGIDWRDIHEVFVTHNHTDHVLGVIWIMRMFCQFMASGGYEGEATIFAHGEVIAFLRDMAERLLPARQCAMVGERVHLVEVENGQHLELIGHDVTVFDIGSTKARQFGFSMDLGGGRALCCCGDEPYNPVEEPYARGATRAAQRVVGLGARGTLCARRDLAFA